MKKFLGMLKFNTKKLNIKGEINGDLKPMCIGKTHYPQNRYNDHKGEILKAHARKQSQNQRQIEPHVQQFPNRDTSRAHRCNLLRCKQIPKTTVEWQKFPNFRSPMNPLVDPKGFCKIHSCHGPSDIFISIKSFKPLISWINYRPSAFSTESKYPPPRYCDSFEPLQSAMHLSETRVKINSWLKITVVFQDDTCRHFIIISKICDSNLRESVVRGFFWKIYDLFSLEENKNDETCPQML